MKALITGGAGFIGGHLANLLLDDGYEVVLVDNFARGVEDSFLKKLEDNPKVEFATVDLLDREKVLALGDDYDYIYHLAAIIGVQNVLNRPGEVLRKNMELLFNVIDLAEEQKHLKRFVFASTSEIYAGTLQFFEMAIPTPEDTPLTITPLDHPRTSYMLSKIYGEAVLEQSGLPFTIVRPHNFYGPRMGMSHVIPELLKKTYAMQDGDHLEVASVEHSRSFCYIDDAVAIMKALAESPESLGQAFNIGNETPEVTIGEVAEVVIGTVGRDIAIDPLPATPGSPVRRCPSMEKVRQCIGERETVSLKDGVKRTFDWYRENVFDGSEVSAK